MASSAPSHVCARRPLKPPKRPLSGYSSFFRSERQRIIGGDIIGPDGRRQPHYKVSFAALAKHIASKWKQLDVESRLHHERIAAADKERYRLEKQAFLNEKTSIQQGTSVSMKDPTPSQHDEGKSQEEFLTTRGAEVKCYYQSTSLAVPVPKGATYSGADETARSLGIADLVDRLDDESMDFLIATFAHNRHSVCHRCP